jgi:hypothetical protein
MTTPTELTQARPRSTRRPRPRGRLKALTMVLLILVAIAGVEVTRGGPAGATALPPWEPDAVNEAGTLSFFDASGHAVTSGDISNPIAAYAQGSAAIRADDTMAQLSAYTPVNGVAAEGWTGEALTAATPYGTAVTYPGDLAGTALPVVTGAASDETLATYIADVPNTDESSTDGYAGIYQLRLQTTQPGQSATVQWDAADVMVSGSTWTQVFPAPVPVTAPDAPTSPTAVAGDGSATVSWTAPASDGGSDITGYTVTSSPGALTCTTTGALRCVVSGLNNGTSYTFKVSATNAVGTGPLSVASNVVVPSGSFFHALVPARVLNSRAGLDNVGAYDTPWTTGTIRSVAVGGLVGVPVDATAVVLNVTVADTTGSSFLTLWPTGAPQPTASSLNWVPGEVVPNAVTVKLGAGGSVSVFNFSGNVNVIVDVAGYYDSTAGDGFTALTPVRILNSSSGADNVGAFNTPWNTGTTRTVAVGGSTGVPADADSVVLNVTVVHTTGSSFLTLWPAGADRPAASSLNWVPGEVIPNAVTVELGASGAISVFNLSGNADVVIDVAGYYQSGTGKQFHPLAPGRILNSRSGADNVGAFNTPWTTGTIRTVATGGLVGVPANATAVVENVTVADTTGSSFLTLWPAGAGKPTASNLNWIPGEVIPNAVTVKLGVSGQVSAYNFSGSTNVIIDVAGYFK